MRPIVCDASVLIKWFVDEPGPDRAAARSILEAVEARRNAARLHELAYQEVGNILMVKRRWGSEDVERVMRLLRALTGTPQRLGPPALADAVHLAGSRGLTVYDATYWALARSLDGVLVTCDHELLAAGAGESPQDLCGRLGLSPTDD